MKISIIIFLIFFLLFLLLIFFLPYNIFNIPNFNSFQLAACIYKALFNHFYSSQVALQRLSRMFWARVIKWMMVSSLMTLVMKMLMMMYRLSRHNSLRRVLLWMVGYSRQFCLS